MGRSPCCAKEGLNRGAWTAHEDKVLHDYITLHGEGRWRNLPKKAGLKRCGKSCRLRWLNYLRPDIKRGNISPDEEELIIRLHKLLGNRWSLIAGRLPGRTDNEIKNYWNTNLSKRVVDHQQLQNSASNLNKNGQPNSDKVRPNLNKNGEPNSDKVRPSQSKVSNVVRTKAAKCTRVFINPPSQKLLDHPPHYEEASRMGLMSEGSSSFSSFDQHNSSSDFLADLDMNEISLASLLNSDFSGMNCHDLEHNAGDNIFSNCVDEQSAAQLFSNEILQHLNGSGDGGCSGDYGLIQPTLVVNFQGDWLGMESG